jgi:hypothetical protein
LLFPFEEQHRLYRKPFEVLSLADFSHYHEGNGTPDYQKFPALKLAKDMTLLLVMGYIIHACWLLASYGIS